MPVRLALLGFWHVHAKDYAKDAAEHPGTEIVAAWDDDPARGQAEADRWGFPFVASLDEILARDDIDGVIVTTATSLHPHVLTAAAQAGKPIFTEKLLALSSANAGNIAAAIREAGVAATVALRWLAHGGVAATRQAITSGMVGEVNATRIRIAHDGAVRTTEHPDGWLPARFFDPVEAGGGILTDLGAHPLYLTRQLLDHLGTPDTVSATYGYATGRAVEDNAVVTFGYGNGAIAVIEASALSRGPLTIEVFGTTGALRMDDPNEPVLFRPGTRDGQWQPLDPIADGPLPFVSWADHLVDGTPLPDTLTLSLDLTTLAEAANRSATDGKVTMVAG